MPAHLVSQQALAEAATKHPTDTLLTQIKETHCKYFSATKPAKVVGFLCMLFDQCLEWVSTHGHSILIKHPVEKLLKKVVEEIMVAVPEYYSTVINDAAFNGAKSLAAPYKAEMANFVEVNMAGKSFPYNQPRDGFHTMVAYRGSSTHSVMQDMMAKAAQNGGKPTLKQLREQEKANLKTGEQQQAILTDPYAEGRLKILKKLGISGGAVLSNDILLSRLVNDQTNKAKVVYMRKQERLKYLLDLGSVASNRISRLNTQTSRWEPLNANLWLYVATKSGEFYAVDDKALVQLGQTGGVDLNHSSILKGRPVLCAGTIRASNGVLTTIDNASGHYAPSWKNLQAFLAILQSKGVLGVRTEVYFLDKGQNSILFLYRWNAWEFLVSGFKTLPRDPNPRPNALTLDDYIGDIERANLAGLMDVDLQALKLKAKQKKNPVLRILRT